MSFSSNLLDWVNERSDLDCHAIQVTGDRTCGGTGVRDSVGAGLRDVHLLYWDTQTVGTHLRNTENQQLLGAHVIGIHTFSTICSFC